MPLNNFGIVDSNAGVTLYRSAQPDTKGCKDLEVLGVNVVLRLNGDGWPVDREQVVMPRVQVIADFIPTFSVDAGLIQDIVRTIDYHMQQGKSVLVHCAHGRDRTGLVIGAYRLLKNGWTLAQVQGEREAYGVNWLVDIGDHEINEALQQIAASL